MCPARFSTMTEVLDLPRPGLRTEQLSSCDNTIDPIFSGDMIIPRTLNELNQCQLEALYTWCLKRPSSLPGNGRFFGRCLLKAVSTLDQQRKSIVDAGSELLTPLKQTAIHSAQEVNQKSAIPMHQLPKHNDNVRSAQDITFHLLLIFSSHDFLHGCSSSNFSSVAAFFLKTPSMLPRCFPRDLSIVGTAVGGVKVKKRHREETCGSHDWGCLMSIWIGCSW